MDFRVAVKSFIVKDGKFLMIKRRPNDVHKPGVWDIPGGRLEIGEDPYEGIKRETMEETGLGIEVVMPIDVKHFVRDDRQKITMIIFLCRPTYGGIRLSGEHTEYKWVGLKGYEINGSDFFKPMVRNFSRLDGAGF